MPIFSRSREVALRATCRAEETQRHQCTVNARTRRHKGREVSLKKRKLVEQIFGWSETIGGLRKARFAGLAKVRVQTFFAFAANNLTRMATIFGWRLPTI